MSILIKGMEMPEYEKIMVVYPDGHTQLYMRSDMAEVPTPHGRLIDAEALMLDILDAQTDQPELAEVYDEDYHAVLDWLRAAPTVIEAEE